MLLIHNSFKGFYYGLEKISVISNKYSDFGRYSLKRQFNFFWKISGIFYEPDELPSHACLILFHTFAMHRENSFNLLKKLTTPPFRVGGGGWCYSP